MIRKRFSRCIFERATVALQKTDSFLPGLKIFLSFRYGRKGFEKGSKMNKHSVKTAQNYSKSSPTAGSAFNMMANRN